MKQSLYLYLFIFASLIALILYVNGRNMQEALENQVLTLIEEKKKLESQLKAAQLNEVSADVFSLKANQEALNYFDNTTVDVTTIEATIFDALLELNANKEGNPLVPFISEGNGFRVNDIKVVNNKWVLANFSDAKKWGELLLIYNFDKDNKVSFEVAKSVLYNAYR